MTLQTIFDRMSLFDNQLDLISGGNDVTRGVTCANLVKDWLISEAATIEGVLTSPQNISTTASQEHTIWPVTLFRLDSIWYVDTTQSPNLPVWELDPIQSIGHHVPGFQWPMSELILSGGSSTTVGIPKEYAATGPAGGATTGLGRIYWAPRPDAIYTMRAYGLWTVADFTAATNEFAFPDTLSPTFTAMAAKVFKIGLDRDLVAVESYVRDAFRPALKGLAKFNRQEPLSRVYSEVHEV